MYFVLEAHVNYVSEMKEGDGFRVRSQILDHDHKRVHLFHTMFAEDDGRLVATNELMLMNIDYASRRSAPWPEWAMERIETMAAAHAGLPRPEQAGSVIAIRKA
jgi:acyl-CoA thioester hydrolase